MKRKIETKSPITGNPYRNTKRVMEVYNVTENQANLAAYAYDNLDTQIGYTLYYDLYKDIKDSNGDESILADLAAEFNWNDLRLLKAFRKLAKEEGREDLL